jgi:hypothetical protein
MADDSSKRGGQDRTRINTEQEHELRYWSEELGVSQEQLKEAVRAAGNQVEKVREHLGRR